MQPNRLSQKIQSAVRSLLQKLPKPVGVEPSGHCQYLFVLSRERGNPFRHIPLSEKTALCFQLLPGRMQAGKAAVCKHLMDKPGRIFQKPLHLKIFFPEFLKIPEPRTLAEKPQIAAPAQKVIIVVGLLLPLFPDAPVLFCRRQYLPVRQINKRRRYVPLCRFPQGDQLRRIVQKGIIALILPLFAAYNSLLVLIGIIQGRRSLCLRMNQHGNEARRILRSLHQDAVRPVGLYGLFQVKCTHRAVVTHRKIQDGRRQIILRTRTDGRPRHRISCWKCIRIRGRMFLYRRYFPAS